MQTFRDIDPEEPANILVFVAFEWTHAPPQSLRLKTVAPPNMPDISYTFDTSHFDRSPLNDDAPRNILLMSFTRDTSHFEISASKELAEENRRLISVTRDTSHDPITPYGLLAHLPLGDSLRHATMALWSCTREIGVNAAVGAGESVS